MMADFGLNPYMTGNGYKYKELEFVLAPTEFKRIREKLRLSQSELAEMFGLSGANVVSNI
jgi:DNA-binding transcriptional regulator YiaG